jgi:hypothetical protein
LANYHLLGPPAVHPSHFTVVILEMVSGELFV